MPSLDQLDAVPWDQISDAYGSASDVPTLIRALAASDPAQRNTAFGQLFTNIWHQGTVYEASIYALPFLIDLLRNKLVPEPDRDSLAMLIACIIAGHGYWEVHQSITLTNPFTKRSVPKPKDLKEKLAKEQQTVAEVRRRGAEAIELLLPYLQNSHADIRATVAESFGYYPARNDVLVPTLQSALEAEKDEDVRATIKSSLERLTRDSGERR
jgi:hypothetical protein